MSIKQSEIFRNEVLNILMREKEPKQYFEIYEKAQMNGVTIGDAHARNIISNMAKRGDVKKHPLGGNRFAYSLKSNITQEPSPKIETKAKAKAKTPIRVKMAKKQRRSIPVQPSNGNVSITVNEKTGAINISVGDLTYHVSVTTS